MRGRPGFPTPTLEDRCRSKYHISGRGEGWLWRFDGRVGRTPGASAWRPSSRQRIETTKRRERLARAEASCNRGDGGPALHTNEDVGEVVGESRIVSREEPGCGLKHEQTRPTKLLDYADEGSPPMPIGQHKAPCARRGPCHRQDWSPTGPIWDSMSNSHALSWRPTPPDKS